MLGYCDLLISLMEWEENYQHVIFASLVIVRAICFDRFHNPVHHSIRLGTHWPKLIISKFRLASEIAFWSGDELLLGVWINNTFDRSKNKPEKSSRKIELVCADWVRGVGNKLG